MAKAGRLLLPLVLLPSMLASGRDASAGGGGVPAAGHLTFSPPVTIAKGCYEPGKKPGDPPRSTCSADAVFGLRRMGTDLIAGHAQI